MKPDSRIFQDMDKNQLVEMLQKYQILLEFNEIILQDLDLDTVLQNVLREALKLTRAEKASIFLINREKNILEFAATTDKNADDLKSLTVPMGKGIAGYVAETGKVVNLATVKGDERFYAGIDQATGSQTQSYLCVPMRVRGNIIGTSQLMNKKGGQFDPTDESTMVEFSRIAAIAIENALLHKASLEKQKFERDLIVAKEIQEKLLPRSFPHLEDYSLYGFTQPAQKVGGDYYQYFLSKGDEEYIDFVICDVSGKGVSASLIVENFDAALKLYKTMFEDIELMMFYVNNFICENIILGKFITAFFARVHRKTGIIHYVNAGHNAPYLFKKKNGKIKTTELKNCGPILGLTKDFAYSSHFLKMDPDDALVAFSDGIVEAMDKREMLFGEKKLIKSYEKALTIYSKNADTTKAQFIAEFIREEINIFQDRDNQHDDLTMVVLTRSGEKM